MGARARRRPLPLEIAILCVLAIPVVALPFVAFYVFSGVGEGQRLAVAQGVAGGVFHPIAGDFRLDETRLDDCTDDQWSCLDQAYANIAYERGPKVALGMVARRFSHASGFAATCHRIAHWIGSGTLARNDGDVGRTLAQGEASCASGYYHGILERAFSGVTSERQLTNVARSLCRDERIRRFSFVDYQCQHGLGHGLMLQTGYELPLALDMCASLATRWDHLSCTGGAFMENVNTSFGYRSQWVSDEDPLYPCNEIDAADRGSCYLRAASRILQLNGRSWKDAVKTCAALDAPWGRFCVRGLGRDVAGEAQYGPKKILKLCRIAGKWMGDCLYGSTRTIMDGLLNLGRSRFTAVCNGAPARFRPDCFTGGGLIVGLLYATDAARRTACVEIAGAYADACTRAAIAEIDPRGRHAWG